tara:strand:+ start:437 stop:628 length:192 start_codon:yes stop_codon:yes gene_type:complete
MNKKGDYMLTKKDFIQVAKQIIKVKDNEKRIGVTKIWIEQFKSLNPRFNEVTFRDYIEKGIYE